jgi:hyaluronoglucosaminidase
MKRQPRHGVHTSAAVLPVVLPVALAQLLAVLLLAVLLMAPTMYGTAGARAATTSPAGPARTVAAEKPAGSQDGLPAVWPAPQQMQARPGSIEVPADVGEVTGQNTDGPALSALNGVLRQVGVQRIVVSGPGQPPPDTPVVFYVGGPSENTASAAALASLGVSGPAGLPAEGYVLAAGSPGNGRRASVVLSGAGGAGTFYAVQTLRQLVQGAPGSAMIHDVAVRDWPSMPLRGVIEGFYGPPWSTAGRLSSFAFDGRSKMDTYVYSPKDDPYLRAQWRDSYPSSQLAVIKQLIDGAAANHVTFTYALSPGLSICFSSPADLQALVTKFQSIWDVGARAFAIPFDDINYSAWNCPQDQAAFGPPGPADAAKAQVHVLNAVEQQFIQAHPGAAPLEFVPTEYADTSATPYKQTIASQLDPHVIAEWTGDGVVVPQITSQQAASARQVFGHDILVWDNYPVNDYITNRLLMGPYTGRDSGLGRYVTGVTANPMIEEEASKVALFTAGAYLWNNGNYDPQAAWLAGIKAIGGHVWPALQVFAENNYSSALNPAESPALTPLITAFWQAWASGTGVQAAAAQLESYFGRMAAAPGQLQAGLGNPDFLSEIGPWLGKLGLYGQAGQAAVRMLLAERSGDGAAAADDRNQLDGLRSQLGAITQQVAPGVMDPFLDKAGQESEQSQAAQVTVTPASPLVRPGATVTVTTAVTATGSTPLGNVAAGLTAPAGWQVTPAHPAQLGTIDPGKPAQAQWTVTAPANAAPGTSGTLVGSAAFSASGQRQAVLGTHSLVVPYPSLASTFGNVGSTDDTDVSPSALNGGIDGDGSSLSAQELATHGLTPGAPFTHGGVTFSWPAAAAGQPDNTLAGGQAITVGGSGSTLGLLTLASYATSRVGGTGEVIYTDGSTQPFTITDPDWQFGPLTANDQVAVTTTYHNLAGTGQVRRSAYIFFHAVPLSASKTVAAVILPTVSNHATGGTPSLHVFAVGVG